MGAYCRAAIRDAAADRQVRLNEPAGQNRRARVRDR